MVVLTTLHTSEGWDKKEERVKREAPFSVVKTGDGFL
jgi:hypothetical protein